MSCRYPGYIVPVAKCLQWDFDLHYSDDYWIEFTKLELMMLNDATSGVIIPDRGFFTYDWWSDVKGPVRISVSDDTDKV